MLKDIRLTQWRSGRLRPKELSEQRTVMKYFHTVVRVVNRHILASKHMAWSLGSLFPLIKSYYWLKYASRMWADSFGRAGVLAVRWHETKESSWKTEKNGRLASWLWKNMTPVGLFFFLFVFSVSQVFVANNNSIARHDAWRQQR